MFRKPALCSVENTLFVSFHLSCSFLPILPPSFLPSYLLPPPTRMRNGWRTHVLILDMSSGVEFENSPTYSVVNLYTLVSAFNSKLVKTAWRPDGLAYSLVVRRRRCPRNTPCMKQQRLNIRQSQCFPICEFTKLQLCRVLLLDLVVSILFLKDEEIRTTVLLDF